MDTQNMYVQVAIFGAAAYALKIVKHQIGLNQQAHKLGSLLHQLPKALFMLLLALPSQAVLNVYEPGMPNQLKAMVALVMYVIHVAYNGMNVVIPMKSYDDLVCILGTSYYAFRVLGVRQETAVALVAANAVTALVVRSIV